MASAASEPDARRFGTFVAGRRIAVGGMAEVFEARPIGQTGPAPFVLKLLLPQYARDLDVVSSLLHEAELARVLSHPNLVAVVGHGIEDGQPWLAMERVDGPTLAELARALEEQGGKLPADLAVHVVRELVRALSCVHEAKTPAGEPLSIVHRDVTPQNVLLSRRGAVLLGDFGIARSGLRDGRTRTGVIKGKLAYLAPEQATGSAIDARTDLYAAGVILWELLAGAPYLAGKTELELLRAAEEPQHRPAGTGDPELEALLARMLRRFPEERPARAAVVLDALDAWLARAGGADRTAALAALVVERFGPGEGAPERSAALVGSPAAASPPPAASPEPSSAPAAPARSRVPLALLLGALALGGAGYVLATGDFISAPLPRTPRRPAEAAPDAGRPATATTAAPATGIARLRDAGTRAPPALPVPPASSLADAGRAPTHATAPRPDTRRGPRLPAPETRPPVVADAGTAPTQAAVDATRAQALGARVAAVRAQLRARGIAPEDLPEPDRARLRTLERDLAAGRLAEAEAALPPLEAAAAAAQVDAALVRRKLDRVDAALSAARRAGRDTSALDELAAAALQSHLDGRLDETNRRLDQILARLRAER